MRNSIELCEAFGVTNISREPKAVTTEVRKKMKENHAEAHRNKNKNKKLQHGYVERIQQSNTDINQELTNGWLRSNIPSHNEGYIMAIQEQEIRTRDLQKKREHPDDNTFNSS